MATIASPSAATSAAIKSRSAPERTASTWPESLSSFTNFGERQRQRLRLGGERVAERAGESVEARVERVVAGERQAQHQTVTLLYGWISASTGAEIGAASNAIVSWPPSDFERTPICSAARKRSPASSSAACAKSCGT